MNVATAQRGLSSDQLEAFYHDEFVSDQVRDFAALVPALPDGGVVADIGGGCGFFARALQASGTYRARVIDMDSQSVALAQANGVEAVRGDALKPDFAGDEVVVSFNLILHHLIGDDAASTRTLQSDAIRVWQGHVGTVFVNEYIYQSYVGNLSGWLIYQITSSRILSWLGRQVARVVPAFKANTFGTGVRFRSHEEWRALFAAIGLKIVGVRIGTDEKVALPLRLLLIRAIRRDSFRLEWAGV